MKELVIKAYLLASIIFATQVDATTIEIVNQDSAGEGFRSTQSVSPVPGNRARTLGQQYLNVFQAAANVWEQRIDSPVTIKIDAALDPLDCSATSGVLGAAGPISGFINFRNAPRSDTIYVVAQANSLAGIDLDLGSSDIGATFNSRIGSPGCLTSISWWLGINSEAPAGTISLYDTVLHEIGHGLGFLSLVGSNGVRLANLDDAFSINLFDTSFGLRWPSLSDAGRRVSSTNNGRLVWAGSNVAAGAGVITNGRTSGLLRLYAPNPFRPGSSVSHWDVTLSPDELMEPFATPTSNGCATILALKDMGWRTMDECEPLISLRVVSPAIFKLLLLDD